MAGIKYWDGSAWQTIPLGVAVYEQASDPGAVPIGSIWIDTDAAAGPGTPELVTSLPTAPVDGQEIYFLADATNGVIWRLRYRSSSASIYKWEYLGGPPLAAVEETQYGMLTNLYTAPATVGTLSMTVPLAGDYDLYYGLNGALQAANTTDQLITYLRVNGVNDALSSGSSGVNSTGQLQQGLSDPGTVARRTLTAGSVLTLAHGGATATGYWVRGRRIRATPIRVG